MTTLLSSAAQVAHKAVTNLLSAAEIKIGQTIPAQHTVKEDDAQKGFTIQNLQGRNVFVGVPGAFTGTCTAQIPGYINAYDEFKAKGITDVYVIAVNDVFTLKAWKDQLAPNGTRVRFLADDKGELTSSLGLLFDATPLLGGPRAKRFVLVTEGDKVTHLAVEPNPGELTITAADKILPLL